MDVTIIKGIITGLILSLPFGPVGIYCMELSLIEGRWKGYAAAMGMVTVDVIYGMIALLFMSNVEGVIIKYESFFSSMVGIFLIAVALRKLLVPMKIKEVNYEMGSFLQNYITGFGFAVANISSVFNIFLIYTTLRVFNSTSKFLVFKLSLGIMIGGSGLWFLTTYTLSRFRKQVSEERLIKICKYASVLILVFGLLILINSFYPLPFLKI